MTEKVWHITKIGGQPVSKQMPAEPSRPRRVGPGAVKKARERRALLERDLAVARAERIQRAVGGEFDVRTNDGSRIERLTLTKASETYEPSQPVITDPPTRRGSKQIPGDIELDDRASLAKSVVVDGPVVENGKVRQRREVAGGGRYPGADVRPL